MSFESILGRIVADCGGGIAAALMENDGIQIAQVRGEGSLQQAMDDDIGSTGVEFSRILGEIRKAADILGAGALHETIVCLSRFSLLFRLIDDDIFLVLAISPDGNLGKARYLMRRHQLDLRAEL